MSPSCLPDWKGLNRPLLEQIKALALELPELAGSAAAAIRRLDIEQFGVEALSDAIVHSFAGDSYFPLLGVLDSDQPNLNHEAIAELARLGRCHAVVTTNFDTLLERAFRKAGLQWQSLREGRRFSRKPRERLSDLQDPRLGHGFRRTRRYSESEAPWVVLSGACPPDRSLSPQSHPRGGFSGADLAFGVDYLALSALKSSSKGISWIVEPGRTLNPHAKAAIESVNGRQVEATIGDVFQALGAHGACGFVDQSRLTSSLCGLDISHR
jgi:hypothetical protein